MRVVKRRLLCILLASAAARSVAAHPAPFSYLDLHLDTDATRGVLVVHDFDAAHELGIDEPQTLLDPAIRPRARTGSSQSSRVDYTSRSTGAMLSRAGVASRSSVSSRACGCRSTLQSRSPAESTSTRCCSPTTPRTRRSSTCTRSGALGAGDPRREQPPLSTRGSARAAGRGRRFLPAGIDHILIGPDHLLFLVGLLLLGGSVRQLALVVTAFTLGPQPDPVPGGARRLSPRPRGSWSPPSRSASSTSAWTTCSLESRSGARPARVDRARLRPHSRFGFASVLREMELPPAALGWSLFSFNLGVEIGQLVVVVVVASRAGRAAGAQRSGWAGGSRWRGRSGWSGRASFWFVQRLFFP